jgi:hypothetical protein
VTEIRRIARRDPASRRCSQRFTIRRASSS